MAQRPLALRRDMRVGDGFKQRSWTDRMLFAFDTEWSTPPFMLFASVLVIFATAIGYLSAKGTSSQLLLVLGVLPIIVMISWLSPRAMLYGLVVWLPFVGFLRRFVPSGTKTSTGDPLLLVGFGILILLFVTALGRGALRRPSPLSKAIGMMVVVGVIECLNPSQGGIKVGIGGFFLVLVPILSFWIGRAIIDRELLRRVFLLVILLGVPAALYGLFQQFIKFPSWDQRWLSSSTGFRALDINGVTRAFSSFASPQEYAIYLSIAIVLVVAIGPRYLRLVPTIVVFLLLTVALVLASVRTQIGLVALALCIMAAARIGFKSIGALLALLIAGLGLFFVFSLLRPTPQAQIATNNTAGQLVNHDIIGLSNPFSSQSSTLSSHIQAGEHGVKAAFTNPLGSGTGSVTQAGQKFGAANAQGAGIDFGNAGFAWGLVGLLLYAVVFVLAFSAAYRSAAIDKDVLLIGGLGILVVTLFQWLNGDLYSVAWLPWLFLGWVDQRRVNARYEVLGDGAAVPTPSGQLQAAGR